MFCNFLWSPRVLYLNHCLCFVTFVRSDDHVTLAFIHTASSLSCQLFMVLNRFRFASLTIKSETVRSADCVRHSCHFTLR